MFALNSFASEAVENAIRKDEVCVSCGVGLLNEYKVKRRRKTEGGELKFGPSEECEAAGIHLRGGVGDRGKDTDRQADGKKNTDTLREREIEARWVINLTVLGREVKGEETYLTSSC